jgi:anaerobic magnesium-protoporphyrin IX monomethyl ester cyclase
MFAGLPDIVRDRDIMWKYRKAGVVHFYIGIEATDQKTLDFIKKDLDVGEGKVALDLIHEQGIVTETSFALGFPGPASSGYLSSPSTSTRTMPTSWPSPSGPMPTCTAKLSHTSVPTVPATTSSIRSLRQSGCHWMVDAVIVECYRKFYFRKVKEVLTLTDPFKRDYLLRAMNLIMSSSFIIKKLGITTQQISGCVVGDDHVCSPGRPGDH